MSSEQPILRIERLIKKFDENEALKSVSLEVDPGDFLVLVGPSGCGKSTLLNCIAGLEHATAGTIAIAGKPMQEVAPKDRDIAMVFQSYALYPTMSVAKNITYGMRVRGIPKTQQREELARVSGQLRIDQLLHRKPSQLSGGQRQRVAMGRALVRKPALFLFDEPLSNLDAKLRAEMRAEIKRLHQRLKTTIVYVTHDQMEAMSLATQIAIMDAGEIIQLAPPQEIYDRPVNLFVAGFIGLPSMNFVPGQLRLNGNQRVVEVQVNGDAMRFDVSHYQFTGSVADGQRVVFGVRPEYVTAASDGDERCHSHNLKLQTLMVETNGYDQYVTLMLGTNEIGGRFSPRVKIEIGKTTDIRIDLESISIFDQDSGDRL